MANPAIDRMKSPEVSWRLEDVERRVCEITADQLGLERSEVMPQSRLVEDLGCDSLELVELVMAIEETFEVHLDEKSAGSGCKVLFTRRPARVSDLAEMVYLQRGTGRPERRRRSPTAMRPSPQPGVPFTQLGGRFYEHLEEAPRFESWGNPSARQFRRRSDGMRCVAIPAATVEIGTDDPAADRDAVPKHTVALDAYLIDAEAISTSAFCRFLNSIGVVDPQTLRDWFVLDPADDRRKHELIELRDVVWMPKAGVERKPMMLVSWYGANAYSLWANRFDWREYRAADSGGECYLPSEAQWEYAARGKRSIAFPWGDDPTSEGRINFGRHEAGCEYTVDELPLSDVNAEQGMSPFGLHHMAGNVWQWCCDWYADDFYRSPAARERNAVNIVETSVRSERGGSFVGPAELCRSSYRRGRNPAARGRCLGFRCVSPPFEMG